MTGSSYLVYDFPWSENSSRFSYAFGELVGKGFLLLVILVLKGFVYAIACRCMRVLCTFKQTNT